MKLPRKITRYAVSLLLVCIFSSLCYSIYVLSNTEQSNGSTLSKKPIAVNTRDKAKESSEIEMSKEKDDHKKKSIFEESEDIELDADDGFPKPNYNIHAFYYPWYGEPKHDDQYFHWNHEFIQHWDRKVAAKWPKGSHVPPDDVGASFYPELGPYSSKDFAVIEDHMKQLRFSGVGVLAVSWYPPNEADAQGKPFDSIIPLLLKAALKYKIKICLHIEPFKDRSAPNFTANLRYIVSRYGQHPAFYKREHKGKLLPLYYIYDSYQIQREEWARMFKPSGDYSVRDTDIDGIFIGLLVEAKHRLDLMFSGFDGLYTYFASNGFTYGSRMSNWKTLASEAAGKHWLFIPSVGPGYNDERVRPWNAINTKERDDGKYYDKSFGSAVEVNPPIITITSFNEWHEGTQIEKAVPKQIPKYKYLDYSPQGSDFYLTLTRKWAFKFAQMKRSQ